MGVMTAVSGPAGFAEALRGHRRAARLTLEQLAEASGVSARTLSDMERGRSRGPSTARSRRSRTPWCSAPPTGRG
ncbi:helix-turn-helix transcriptional regulator [Streptomyces sp. NPDC048659]|uniref:helix-turn-helix domain-containing protein n=1 Tax=Streptomyces sp. NPDC048659 TaxID=3155489 RepID=UPI003434BF1F